MIMADLKTNYVDDVLDTTKNQLRKYQQIQNDDGTVSFVDVTEYTQVGTSFGARDINDTNAAINDVNGKLLNITTKKVSFPKGNAIITIDGIKKGACIIAMRNVISNGTVVNYVTSALCDTDGVVKLYLNTNVSSITTDVTIIWANL